MGLLDELVGWGISQGEKAGKMNVGLDNSRHEAEGPHRCNLLSYRARRYYLVCSWHPVQIFKQR